MNHYLLSDKTGIANDPFFQDFNLLFRNAFSTESNFQPFVSKTKVAYPMNAWFNDEHYVIEIPVIKGSGQDIEVTKTPDKLRIKYTKPTSDTPENVTYVCRGIVQRDFDFEWKISSKFDSKNIRSTFENGLLTVYVPFAEETKPEKVEIQTA